MSVRECTQCAAETRRGTRCKLRTCIYSEFCHTHTKQLFDLALKPSHIPNSGKGLFTLKPIPKNANIANYTGVVKTQEEYNANPSNYGIAISKGRIIDAASTQSAIGRYANDCRNINRQAGQCNGSNSRFVINNHTNPPSISLRATKNIIAGSEIYVSYGAAYWRDGSAPKKAPKKVAAPKAPRTQPKRDGARNKKLKKK